jgi:hypothetical protein
MGAVARLCNNLVQFVARQGYADAFSLARRFAWRKALHPPG